MGKRYFLMCTLFSGIFGVYFMMTEQWMGGLIHIGLSIINMNWFIREVKRGGRNERCK